MELKVNADMSGLINFEAKLNAIANKVKNNELLLKQIADKFKIYVQEFYSTYGLKSNLSFETVISKNKATITLNGKKFVFVEFGTGVVGQESPNKLAGNVGYQYNAKKRLTDNPNSKFTGDYWGFMAENGEFIVTKGMPSRPFFSTAIRKLDDILLDMAKDYFRS